MKGASCVIISVIIYKNNITQNDDHQFPCELFRSNLYNPNHNRSTTGFQTFDTSPFLLLIQRTIKKISKSLKIMLLQSLTLSYLVVTKGHTYLNKPAAEVAGLFECVWRFGTTWRENRLKRSQVTYQNQSKKSLQNMIFWNWLFFFRRNSKHKEVLLTQTLKSESWLKEDYSILKLCTYDAVFFSSCFLQIVNYKNVKWGPLMQFFSLPFSTNCKL